MAPFETPLVLGGKGQYRASPILESPLFFHSHACDTEKVSLFLKTQFHHLSMGYSDPAS